MKHFWNQFRERILNLLSLLFAWGSMAFVVAICLALLWSVLYQGFSELSFSMLTDAPEDAGRGGGIGPMIISTLLIVGVCLASSIPVGLGTAILLAEHSRSGSRLARFIRLSLNISAGVPSIVFGLFGSVFFCQVLGMGYSILAGGLTLACMVLPIFVRVVEEGFRSSPQQLRFAAAALGLSKLTTLYRITLPSTLPALAAGLTLGTGRAIAETAALIFTSGYVTRTPESLFDSGRSLSVHVYDMAMNVPGGNPRAFASAAVLVTILISINALTMVFTRHFFDRNSVVPKTKRLDSGALD